jgi:ATP-dependent protease Clp ATPase subunit
MTALSLPRIQSYNPHRFIPEFISRLPTVTTLAPLTPSDLLRILTDVRGSLVSQYTALFGYSGVDIQFTTLALKEICRKAAERGGGARGLRGIMVGFGTYHSAVFNHLRTLGDVVIGCNVRSPRLGEFSLPDPTTNT